MPHTTHSVIPKIDSDHLCDAFKLCSVREKDWVYMIAVKFLDWRITEIPLDEIIDADTYEWLPIVRTYSSWCVFISPDKTQVYLVTTEKDWKEQHQFTWWSPIEQDFSNIIFKKDDHLKVDLYKIEDNAVHRTKNRTWAQATEFYNEKPLVDRILQEKIDENNKKYRRLVLLMHFVVKKYEWNLWFNKWVEGIVDGKRYDIADLPSTPEVAANAFIVTNKALELIK